MVLLDQDRVEEAQAVVEAPAGEDRRLLEPAQAWGRLAGVEDAGPVPATASTKRAVRVATPERWPSKLSAVRSAASSAGGGAGRKQDLGRHPLPPLALDDQVVDLLDPALAHRLGDGRQAEDDARLLLDDPGARPGPAGTVAAEVTSPSRRPRRGRARRSRSGSRRDRASAQPSHDALHLSRMPGNVRSRPHVRTLASVLIHVLTALPPFQVLIDGTPGRDGGAARRGGPQRRRRLLPGDLSLRPARLPAAEERRQPARLAADDRPPQGDRPSPRQRPPSGPRRRGRRGRRSPTRANRGGIWDAVGALPPKQRAAVTLRYACDLPHAEIAAALGCSPAAARRSLHEGIKRLRKELA